MEHVHVRHVRMEHAHVALVNEEHVMSTRVARSGALAAEEPSSPTMRLEMCSRLSTCLAASDARAPATQSCDLSDVPTPVSR